VGILTGRRQVGEAEREGGERRFLGIFFKKARIFEWRYADNIHKVHESLEGGDGQVA